VAAVPDASSRFMPTATTLRLGVLQVVNCRPQGNTPVTTTFRARSVAEGVFVLRKRAGGGNRFVGCRRGGSAGRCGGDWGCSLFLRFEADVMTVSDWPKCS
jgi:hypothetical protein